jgi:hypothetical protein
LFDVSRGLRGAFLRVRRGLGGVDLSEPPGNSQVSVTDFSLYIGRVYLRVRLNRIIVLRIAIGIKILGVCKGPDRELTYDGDIVYSLTGF